MSLVCAKCNRENRDEAKYCRFCGEIFSSIPAPVQAEQARSPEPVSAPKKIETSPDGIIGLEKQKLELEKFITQRAFQKKRGQQNSSDSKNIIFVFKGNTGTGKTTLAKWFCERLKDEKVLNGRVMPDFTAKQLRKSYQDEFEIKNFISQNKPGLIMIDDAHEDISYFHELLLGISKDKSGAICVLSGLKSELDKFFDENKNANQYVYCFIDFDDCSDETLLKILIQKLKDMKFSDELKSLLLDFIIERRHDKDCQQYNCWLIENDVIKAIFEKQAERLKNMGNPSDEDCKTIIEDDIPIKSKPKNTDEIFKELNKLIGLEEVKKSIHELLDTIELEKQRQESGAAGKKEAVHIVFTGNPGTGKTTVARILGKLFKSIGLLPSDKVIETDKSGMVSGYANQTAIQVNKICDSAMGGILFIDEAYSIANDLNMEGSFGKEAIDALLKRMEDDRGKFVVIAAGYEKEMKSFINSNPGLQSRFTHFIHLSDYTPDELFQIYKLNAESNDYVISEDAVEKLKTGLEEIYKNRGKDFANGRTVRNLFDDTRRNLAGRVSKMQKEERTKDVLSTICACDLPFEEHKQITKDDIFKELDDMIGLTEVKVAIKKMFNSLQNDKLREAQGMTVKKKAAHIIFTGNPGTGKTTVARILGKLFKAIGMLPTDNVVETDRGGLVAGYEGQTAILTKKVCDDAMGGILFIDEAYTLSNSVGSSGGFGQEAIDTLVKEMEDNRDKFIVIVAGYKKEMKKFIESNSGLASRFSYKFDLEDYKPDELLQIYKLNAKKAGYTISEDAIPLLEDVITKIYDNRDDTFANGRTIRNLFEKTQLNQDTRIGALPPEDLTANPGLLSVIEKEDIPLYEDGGEE